MAQSLIQPFKARGEPVVSPVKSGVSALSVNNTQKSFQRPS